MQNRETKKTRSTYDQFQSIAGPIANNVMATAAIPTQPNAQAYQVNTAGACMSTSWSILNFLQGNYFESVLFAAAGTYFTIGVVNQLGKEKVLAAVSSVPGSIMGLFSKPAQPQASAPAPEAVDVDVNKKTL